VGNGDDDDENGNPTIGALPVGEKSFRVSELMADGSNNGMRVGAEDFCR